MYLWINIVKDYTSGSIEDRIKGKIEDIDLEFGELNLKVVYDKSFKTVFKGGVFIFTMPFEFKSNTRQP